MQVAAIVPTLNEERTLAATLERLLEHTETVIVSDGGSDDATRSIAARFPVHWTAGPAGRGAQLNRGAADAAAEILLFVHADTSLPDDAIARVREAVADGRSGGGFCVRFDSGIPIMALGARLVNLRTRISRLPLGDQAQFVRAETFRALGGFRDWPILEDLDFMRRLKQQGPVAVIDSPVTTSDRRYARRGVARTVATNWLIWTLYVLGVAPGRLARLYRDVR